MKIITQLLLNKKWFKIGIHILIWAVIILSNYIFDYGDVRVNSFQTLNAATNLFRAGIFYLNAWVLVPNLIYRKKYLSYLLALIAVFCVMMLYHATLFPMLAPVKFNLIAASAHNVIAFIITITVSTAFKTISDRSEEDTRTNEMLKENLKTEVSFLRSQISPHFIFNVLNNIVALVRLKSDELEPTVMKLSALMQYMLYQTDKKVSLQNEILYLENYIELQKQRFGDFIKISTDFRIPSENLVIEPMLLICFVENAFKHGEGLIEDPMINIELHCDKKKLYLNVQNKYNDQDNGQKDKTSGIGLANVRRRLALLYPGKHTLVINQSEGFFYVLLQLDIEPC